MIDAIHVKEEEIGKSLNIYRGVLFGTPTIVNDALPPVWQAVNRLNPMINMGQVAGVFGSYGKKNLIFFMFNSRIIIFFIFFPTKQDGVVKEQKILIKD